MNLAGWVAERWPKAFSISSIRGRMAVFLALALLPAGAIAIQTGVNTAASRNAAVAERSAANAISAARDVGAVFTEMSDVLRVLSTTDLRAGAGNCQRRLEDLAGEYQRLASVGIINLNGSLRCSVPRVTADTRAGAVFDRARDRGDLAFGYAAPSTSLSGLPVFGAVTPLRNSGGTITGYAGLSSPSQRLRQVIEASRLDDSASVYFVDSTGAAVAPAVREDSEEPVALPAADIIRAHIGASGSVFTHDGNAVLVTPLHAPDLYWVSVWRPPTQSLSDQLSFAFAVAAPMLMWAIAIAVGWIAIELFVARPLSQVEAAARDFARGADIPSRAAFAGAPVEIRNLYRTLSAMARTLRVREQRLTEALKEERALLREVHHRVKNNLQIVASLLNIQARAAGEGAESWGLARAHDRVQLLSIVHQRIYSSGEVREVRLDEITRDIANHMVSSRGSAIAKINLELTLGEVRCNVDHAVPMGFLVGEALSNALDHAPPEGEETLCLRLMQDEVGAVRFTINAPLQEGSEPPTPDPRLRLIDAFARQLGADVARTTEGRYRVWAQTPALRAAA